MVFTSCQPLVIAVSAQTGTNLLLCVRRDFYNTQCSPDIREKKGGRLIVELEDHGKSVRGVTSPVVGKEITSRQELNGTIRLISEAIT